jgi:phage baseplate assembly protein W
VHPDSDAAGAAAERRQLMSGPILTSSRGPQIRPPLCWPLLPLPDENGRLGFPDLEASVRQRIEAVLRTSPGEQLMRPYFGAGLELAIHRPNNAGVRAELQRDIAAHIRAFEPRIVLDQVEVSTGGDPSLLIVTIGYRIRQIGVATAITVSVPVGGA